MVSLLSLLGLGSLLGKTTVTAGATRGIVSAAKTTAKGALLTGFFGHEHPTLTNIVSRSVGLLNRSQVPDQPLKIRQPTVFETATDLIRPPLLQAAEFRVDPISLQDPIKSIDKINASIVSYLNVVNKNTTQVFNYVHKSFTAQDQKIDELRKTSDRVLKTHDDLSRRMFKLELRLKDLEVTKKGGLTGFDSEIDDNDNDDVRKEDEAGGGGILGDILKKALPVAGGYLGYRALRRALYGNRPARATRGFRGRATPRTPPRAPATEPVRPTPRAGAEPIRPGSGWSRAGRIARGIGRGAARALGPVGTAITLYEAYHTTAQQRLENIQQTEKDRENSFSGFGSKIWNHFSKNPINPETGIPVNSQEVQDNYTLKKTSIAIEAATDIRLFALNSIELRSRKIVLKADSADSIIFDSPRIVFTSEPIIESKDTGFRFGQQQRRQERITNMQTKALGADQTPVGYSPELLSSSPMTPGGVARPFSGGGSGGGGGGFGGVPGYEGPPGFRRGGGSGGRTGRGGRGTTTPNDAFEKTARESFESPKPVSYTGGPSSPYAQSTETDQSRTDSFGQGQEAIKQGQQPSAVPGMGVGHDAVKELPTWKKGDEGPVPFSQDSDGIDRSKFKAAIENDPALVEKLASMVKGEVTLNTGEGPRDYTKQIIQLASHFDRTALRQLMGKGNYQEKGLWTDLKPASQGGYYAGTTFREVSPEEVEHFRKNILAPVLEGANPGEKRFGFVPLGNASGDWAQNRLNQGQEYDKGMWFGSQTNTQRANDLDEMYVQHKGESNKIGLLPRLPSTKGEPGQFQPVPTYGTENLPEGAPGQLQMPRSDTIPPAGKEAFQKQSNAGGTSPSGWLQAYPGMGLPGPDQNNQPTSQMGMARGRLHAGNDFYTPVGTPLVAQGNGKVTAVGDWHGYGHSVVIQYDNGYTVQYSHLSRGSALYKEGQTVKAGQQFATSGASGTNWENNPGQGTPPHVHLEIVKNEHYQGSSVGGISSPSRPYLEQPHEIFGFGKEGANVNAPAQEGNQTFPGSITGTTQEGYDRFLGGGTADKPVTDMPFERQYEQYPDEHDTGPGKPVTDMPFERPEKMHSWLDTVFPDDYTKPTERSPSDELLDKTQGLNQPETPFKDLTHEARDRTRSQSDLMEPTSPGAHPTFYAPGGEGAVGKYKDLEGGFETSGKNKEGEKLPQTLDDVRLGKSDYVSIAAEHGKTNQQRQVAVGTVTYRSPIDGMWYTLKNVKGFIHDVGSDFKNRLDKFDIATGDFRNWAAKEAAKFVSGNLFGKEMGPKQEQQNWIREQVNKQLEEEKAAQQIEDTREKDIEPVKKETKDDEDTDDAIDEAKAKDKKKADDAPDKKDKETESAKTPNHDPEAEKPGANDSGYGSQHRNSGDMTGTTDNNEE